MSPANEFWVDPEVRPIAQDLETARALLRDAGFRLDGESNQLLDQDGASVRFRLMTSPSTTRQRTAAFIQEDLARVGIAVDLVVVDAAGLMGRLLGDFDYDACLLGITQLDPDPSAELPIWTSSGQLHVWSPAQERPATEWERELDELMMLQMRSLDPQERLRLYREVQRVVRRELPIIDLVYPHVLFGAQPRVAGLIPTPFGSVLWNLEEISLDGESPSTAAVDLFSVTRITEKY